MESDKHGPWLFEPAKGLQVNCVYITKSGRVLMAGSPVLWTVQSFEDDDSVFVRWLGPAHPPTTRDAVSWFAQQMELKLKANDHKEGWRHMAYRDIQGRIKEELQELWKALFLGEGDVISESADVANFCMMIADNWRQDNATNKD